MAMVGRIKRTADYRLYLPELRALVKAPFAYVVAEVKRDGDEVVIRLRVWESNAKQNQHLE